MQSAGPREYERWKNRKIGQNVFLKKILNTV